MARLRGSATTHSAGRRHHIFRLGEQEATAEVATWSNDAQADVSAATVTMFEDGSGFFTFKRGQEDIKITWTPEDRILFEMHANFSGVEGVLKPTSEPVEVPEGSNDN